MHTISRSSLGLLLAFVVSMILCSCGGKGPSPEPSTDKESGVVEWRDHLSEYSKGWVGAEETLVFRFAHSVIDGENLGKPLDGIVKLSPDVDCVAVFPDESTLEVRHPRPFDSGQKLGVTLLPDRLLNLPAGMPPLRYTVQALEQGIILREIGLSADPNRQDRMWLEGELTTADSAAPQSVEAVLRATQGDKALGIVWKHVDARRHRFTIEDILREPETSRVIVSWDGKPLGIESKGERTVEIPAAARFAVASVRVVQTPDTYIEVRFSDAADTKQNLAGLVRVNDADARAQWEGINTLRVFGQSKLKGDARLRISAGLRSARGKTLGEDVDRRVTFAPELPAVRFAEKGHIMPAASRLTIPFEAVAVNSVLVRAFEIYPDNIGQYLQDQNISYSSESGDYYYEPSSQREVGRYLWQKTLTLPKVPLYDWERFELDVTELIKNKKGSLIRLELQILPQFSAYSCETPPQPLPDSEVNEKDYDGYYQGSTVPEYLERYYESAGYYQWDQRKNPCSSAYYRGGATHVSQIFFASSIGMLAKQGGDDRLDVLTTDLLSALPLPNTPVWAYNYQHQVIGSGMTDISGLVTMTVQGVPFYVKASKAGDTAYLKVARNDPLPTSQFDTGGARPEQGLKGFFYGERDIWRPGDDIHLTFILMDRDNRLPANYPLTMEFFDPRGKKVAAITNAQPVGDFYAFPLRTEDDAPTGNWRAIIKIGDSYFDQVVKIENIAPNHLRMDLTLPEKGLRIDRMPWKASLSAQWLNGATAALLKADVQVRLSAGKTVFQGYEGYRFDDKARAFTQEPQPVFEGTLDGTGAAEFDINPRIETPPPGVLNAVFTERVFEPGGQFSTQYRSVPFYPFTSWVGIHAPAGDKAESGSLEKDADHVFDLVSLDIEGKPMPNRRLNLALIGIGWRWWWDQEDDDLVRYISDPVRRPLEDTTVTTDGNGHAQWTLRGSACDWGRYLVRVCDAGETGVRQQCASQEIYLGWGYGDSAGRDSATRMALSTDRERYAVGDTAVIRLPDGPDRQVFVSIENGNRILARSWERVSAGKNQVSLSITPEMTPNVYVYVAQLQPYQGRNNDLPIRSYGIVPLMVDDQTTHLTPVIGAPEKVRPETPMDIEVSEQSGRAMTYTLAMVDEGLLGVTDYRTPDPHDSFYRREALGVLTWDLFDLVVGAYGADLSRMLAVGGGDAVLKRDSNRERRFPPVVKFFGPFELASGQKRKQRVELPPYMGAVRIMVVAGDGRAFGEADKTVTVTQPLTVLSTLPRVLGPGEEVDLPVTVFVSEQPFGTAKVHVETDEVLAVLQGERQVEFDKPGEQTVGLRLRVNDRVGMAKVVVVAELGNETAREAIHIPVRSANLPTVTTESYLLDPGKTWQPNSAPHGMLGTNTTSLVVSRAPELHLEQRLDYLISFPHGCIEQTTSTAFPQIYLPSLVEMNSQNTSDIENNVNAAIQKMAGFQNGEGAFCYWPYGGEVEVWANNYAGHFLLEAKRNGYSVPPALLDNWLKYQQLRAQGFQQDTPYGHAGQAYRLYTLALAGQSDAGAMNRLRDVLMKGRPGTNVVTCWMLALAYQQAGLPNIALELLDKAGEVPRKTDYESWYYGSPVRDLSILLLLRHRLGQEEQEWQLGEELARSLAKDTWYSTQTTAWALLSLAQAFGGGAQETRFSMRTGGADWQPLTTQRAVWMQTLDTYVPGQLELRNDGDKPLHVALCHKGIPASGEEKAVSRGLSMVVRFTDMKGLPIDIRSLPQGEDFAVEATVRNIKNDVLENVALTQVVPSGWQIRNTRLEGMSDQADLDYQDIRDDRLVSYFPLAAKNGRTWPWLYDLRGRARSVKDTVTVKMLLNASFAGRFYLPGWRVEPMYDESVQAAVSGQWVEVHPR